jgi:uncharacterized membrane protein
MAGEPCDRDRPVDVSLDLAAVAVLAVVAAGYAVALRTGAVPDVVPPAVREVVGAVLGVALVLFLPGYAVVAALFPRASHDPEGATDDGESVRPPRYGLAPLERVVLAVGASLALVPLVTVPLIAVGAGFALVPVVGTLAAVAVLGAVVALRRRLALPTDQRFGVSLRELAGPVRAAVRPATPADAALNVALAIAVVVAVGGVVYATGADVRDPSFTEFYLLVEGPDGDLVADDYPTTVPQSDPASLVVGVTNRGDGPRRFTVVVLLQRVAPDDETRVLRSDELARFENTVAVDDQWLVRHEVAPTFTGEDLRVRYLLYEGNAPASASADSADDELHLWVDVPATGTVSTTNETAADGNATATATATTETPRVATRVGRRA